MKNFIKFFFITFFSVLFFTSNSVSEVVNKVKVNGNDRVSIESIVVFGDIKMGENYEIEDVNQLIKKLYETNFFSNIKINIIDGELTITVSENPIVNSIVFDGEKAQKYIDTLNHNKLFEIKIKLIVYFLSLFKVSGTNKYIPNPPTTPITPINTDEIPNVNILAIWPINIGALEALVSPINFHIPRNSPE